MRKYGRTDGNHTAIIKALRELGCSVQSLASLGSGVPDLLIARCGAMALLEIKDGTKPPSHRKLTPDEEQWIFKWNAPVHVVKSIEEAVAVVNLMQ